MKLFYVTRGRGYEGTFVHATSPHEAVRVSGTKLNKVQVFDLSQGALCPSVLAWDEIPMMVLTRD